MREFLTGTDYEPLSSAGTVHFQNVGKGLLVVKRSVLQPDASEEGWVYPPGTGERGRVVDLYPTEAGTLWAKALDATFVYLREL